MQFQFMKVKYFYLWKKFRNNWSIKCLKIGFALPLSIVRSDVAGRDVTRYLKLLLR